MGREVQPRLGPTVGDRLNIGDLIAYGSLRFHGITFRPWPILKGPACRGGRRRGIPARWNTQPADGRHVSSPLVPGEGIPRRVEETPTGGTQGVDALDVVRIQLEVADV